MIILKFKDLKKDRQELRKELINQFNFSADIFQILEHLKGQKFPDDRALLEKNVHKEKLQEIVWTNLSTLKDLDKHKERLESEIKNISQNIEYDPKKTKKSSLFQKYFDNNKKYPVIISGL